MIVRESQGPPETEVVRTWYFRDTAAFLRWGPAASGNPCADGLERAYVFGVSQSGRYLRDHVALGFNQDEAGRKVIDGYLSHVAGIGKVFANYEFGQPYRTRTQHEDHWFPENHFPFAHATLTDPVTVRIPAGTQSGAVLRVPAAARPSTRRGLLALR